MDFKTFFRAEMKRYVDEKIDYTKLEIQGSLYPNQEEENVITSHLDHNEGQESQNEHLNQNISQVLIINDDSSK